MKKGLLTLFAGAITFAAITPAFALAPIISGIPDITVGDAEAADNPGGTDNNRFVFTNAFQFSSLVSDGDTADSALLWSFSEFDDQAGGGDGDGGGFTLPTPQYQINGKNPVNAGDAAIAADELAGSPNAKNPGANRLNDTSDFASFRDIIFSPLAGSAPFAERSPAEKAAGLDGKIIAFNVADPEGNLTSQSILIRTVDDGFDGITASDGYQEEFQQSSGFNTTPGWIPSGVDSGPEYPIDPTSIDDVDLTSTSGELQVIVRPSTTGRLRVAGWIYPTLLDYNDFGAARQLRGKFYVYTSNAASDPVNVTPNFRIRLSNEGAQTGAALFQYARTGEGNVPHEPLYNLFNNPAAETSAGQFLKPSSLASQPSLYRVDLDPVDVPAAVGSDIGPLFETLSNANPANATLSLTEVVIGSYTALADVDGALIWSYDRTLPITAGGAKVIGGQGFNAEANLEAGRLPALFLPPPFGSTPASQLATVTTTPGPTGGIVVDTANTPASLFGVGLLDLNSVNNADKPRIEAGKLYRARYYVTSDVSTGATNAAEVQGFMRFRMQTAASSIGVYQELLGPQSSFNPNNITKQIAVQALPGIGSQNPETSAVLDTPLEDGGWYTVMLPSPLDVGIRPDGNYGTLITEAGPGSAANSALDITLGADLVEAPATLQIAPGPGGVFAPYAQPNRVKIRVSRIELRTYPSINDGGYDPTP